MSDWLVQEFLLGNTGLNSEFVDGYFLDDFWAGDGAWGCNGSPADGANPAGGPTEMSANCTRDMGLSASEIVDISTHWHTNYVTAKAVAVAAKGFEWHLLQKTSTPPAGPLCEAFFRRACAENSVEHDSALFVPFGGNSGNGRAPNATNDLATFLLVRGEYAWIGHDFVGAFCPCLPFCLCVLTTAHLRYGTAYIISFIICRGSVTGCSTWDETVGGPGELFERPPVLDSLNVGTPVARCEEHASRRGVFVRKWTGASVQFDCATGIGSVNATHGGGANR